MRAALPNAFYFGFTGTPVDKGQVGRGTFETFGKPDPTGYLDKYGIDESVDDGTTVRLFYTLTPLDLRLDRDTLEKEFFQEVERAGIASIEQLNQLLDRNEHLKAVLKAPDRIDRIARHIAQHYREKVEPLSFKGFVVGVDREACALYKTALDRYLPASYTQVVYSANSRKDGQLLRRHHINDVEEKRIRKAFRDPDVEPRILIVTQKLLTGYDAPVLYAMYLDKPLKDHTLLQAIARVNRPYPTKESGLIVDYIGIFENLQRALAFEDETITKGLIDIEELKAHFVKLLEQIREMLAPIDLSGRPGRSARIIDHFCDQKPREAFTQRFKQLQIAYEILAPDPFLRDYLDDYAFIAQIYQLVYDTFNPEAEKRRQRYELLKKTDALVRTAIGVEELTELPLYPINRDIANVVRDDNVTDRVKIANLYRSLTLYIEQHQAEQPYLFSLAERVEEVIQKLHDRQVSTQTALYTLSGLVESTASAQEEQVESGMDAAKYALYWVLRGQGLPDADAEARAGDVEQVLLEHPGWAYNPEQERAAHLRLYAVLAPHIQAENKAKALKEIVTAMLRMRRMVNR